MDTKSFAGNPHSVSRPKTKPMKLLTEGDVIVLTEEHTVYQQGNSSAIKLTGEYASLQGEYVVTRTEMKGGGQGHGRYDYYPDGHHVECVGINTKQKVSFYQTGSFTAMIENIKIIRKMEINLVFKDK